MVRKSFFWLRDSYKWDGIQKGKILEKSTTKTWEGFVRWKCLNRQILSTEIISLSSKTLRRQCEWCRFGYSYKKPKHTIGKKRCRVPRDEGLGAAWYNASCSLNRFCLQRQLSDDRSNPAVTRLWFTSYRITGKLSMLHHSALTNVLTRAFNVLEQHYFPWYHKV